MKTSFELKGFEELEKRLRQLPRRVAGPISAKATLAGLKVGADRMESASPPTVERSIGYRLARKRSAYVMSGKVGVNVGRRNREGTRWAAIQVTGSQPRFRTSKTGKRAATGRIIANAAAASALDSAASDMVSTATNVLAAELAKLN
ncbi:MAG: hypothetical protein WCH39_01620 [Schlesneria sp.]